MDKIKEILEKRYGSPDEYQEYNEEVAEEIQALIEQEKAEIFKELETPALLEIGRKAIEDTLVEWRDNRLSEFTRGNGLVIREKDGKDSHIIRFGPETALKIGLEAMEQALKKGGE